MVVKSSELEGTFPQTQSTALPMDAEKTCFAKLERNFQKAPDDVDVQAGIIYDVESKSARVPWLKRTQFASFLPLLKDREIRSPYKLPQ